MRSIRVNSRAGVSVEQRWRLDHLLSVLASLALEGVVRVANGFVVELEELSHRILREMSFGRLGLVVDDAGGKRHLVGSGSGERKKSVVSNLSDDVRGASRLGS